MLIFDDSKEFADSIALKPWVMSGWEVKVETNWQNLDVNFFLNDAWNIIITDVDMPGAQFDGHEMIRRRIVERKLNVPVIVMSGAYGLDLEELQKKHGMFFSAYISKNDRDFYTILRTEVDRVTSISDPLARLAIIFDQLGKLDERVSEDTVPKKLHELGLLDLSANETVRTLIDKCKDMDDKKVITDYLWEKVAQFRKKRR